MGDRYELSRKCVYCGEFNEDIWYAPTCNSYTFQCIKCMKINFITSDLKVIKLEKATLRDIKDGFENTTNSSLTEKEIDEICNETLKRLKELGNIKRKKRIKK